jgi:hypothetical protein
MHLCNHCCREKAVSITYCSCMFVALGIQQEMRRHHIVFCGLSSSTPFLHRPDRWRISFCLFCFFHFNYKELLLYSQNQVSSNCIKLDSEKYETTNEHHIQLSRQWVLYIHISDMYISIN